jgi:hypothetical protein
MRGQRENRVREEGASEVTMEELQEFLEGDGLDVPADPEFKERLRQSLWEMVRVKFQKPRSDA